MPLAAGTHLLEEAIKQGYTINILVRDRDKLTVRSSSVTVFEGVPTDAAALLAAAQGCEAILSTLNISRTSDFPWAPLRSPKGLLSATMKNIIGLADQLQIKRIIITTAWGVNETKKDIPAWFRSLIDHSNIGYPYRDHELQENLLKTTTLNWTAIRPAGLTNSLKDKPIKVSINNSPKPGLMISRRNVARFMLKVLQEGLYVKQCPAVWDK